MYLDLEFKARTDGQFRAKLQKTLGEFTQLQEKAKTHSKYGEESNAKLLEFLKLCNYNPFFLVGYYFPKYPRDTPLSFAQYPHVGAIMNMQVGGFTVVRGSRQTAKSTSFGVHMLLLTKMLPKFRSIYICPRSQQLKTFANRLREIERAYRFYKTDNQFRSNLMYKEFPNGSVIELIHVLTDASPARGKSADLWELDESQDFDGDLEPEVSLIQSASKLPMTIFSGTSLTTDTFLEAKYLLSSQGVWSIRCHHCQHMNIPLPEFQVLDMIQPQGPSCVKCGGKLIVERGQYVHAFPKMLDINQPGLHVPQIIVPAVVNDPMRWAAIYKAKTGIQDKRKFFQEYLGIPSEEGEREITRKHIEAICVLDRPEVLQAKARKRKTYEHIVSGCDWGGADPSLQLKIKVSTTVHVVMGVLPTGEFDILHMYRYSGMDYDEIAASICAKHLDLGGKAIATDVGVGAAYNSRIRQRLPADRHLMFQYMGPGTPYLAEPKGEHTFNQWNLNKTDSLTDLFEAVRKLRIRCYPWDMAQEHLLDFLNMYRAPSELPGGKTTMLYRPSATKPNDIIQACNYCYVLGRVLRGEPIYADISVKQRMEQTMFSGDATFMDSLPHAFSR